MYSQTTALLLLCVILVGHAYTATSNNAYETIFNVIDFGAKGDGTTLDTLAIVKAIASCHQQQDAIKLSLHNGDAPGCVVYFPVRG